MPQYPYLKVTERLGPVMNAQRLAKRLMMRLREHQAAGATHLTNEFVTSHGLLSDLVNESTSNFLNRNFTMQSLPEPLSFHGSLTISQPQFQQSTILFTLQNKEGNEVKFDVENVSSSYSLKLPSDASNNLAVLATEKYVDQKVIKLINGAPATLDTLNELSTALGNDANFATTISTTLGNCVKLDTDQTIQGTKTFDNTIIGNIDNVFINLQGNSTNRHYITFVKSSLGANKLYTHWKLYYNPSTNTIGSGVKPSEDAPVDGEGELNFEGSASKLNKQEASYYLNYSNFTNKPTTITSDQAGAIALNTAKVSFPGFGTTSSTALRGSTTTITYNQGQAIATNTNRTVRFPYINKDNLSLNFAIWKYTEGTGMGQGPIFKDGYFDTRNSSNAATAKKEETVKLQFNKKSHSPNEVIAIGPNKDEEEQGWFKFFEIGDKIHFVNNSNSGDTATYILESKAVYKESGYSPYVEIVIRYSSYTGSDSFTANTEYKVSYPVDNSFFSSSSNNYWNNINSNICYNGSGNIGIGNVDPKQKLHVTGQVVVSDNITAYYSDERLKTFKGKITDPIEKIKQLNGYYFVENELAKSLGYNNNKVQVGVSAQEVETVLPEIVTKAPIDNNYKTVWYEKLTPLLIEGIKEQQKQIEELKEMVQTLLNK